MCSRNTGRSYETFGIRVPASEGPSSLLGARGQCHTPHSARRDKLQMNAFRVSIPQIFSIWRNCSVEHRRILSVCREFLLIELGQRFGMAGEQPRNHGGADECHYYKQRRNHTAPMSTDEFARAITNGVG